MSIRSSVANAGHAKIERSKKAKSQFPPIDTGKTRGPQQSIATNWFAIFCGFVKLPFSFCASG
jgi:hypothetical protein